MSLAAGATPARAQGAFEIVSPERLDAVAHEATPLEQPVTIHAGKAALAQLRVVTTRLVDAPTARQIAVTDQALGPCAADRLCTWIVRLPAPLHAGAYTGVLTLEADGSQRRSVPIVIRSRGPKILPWTEHPYPLLPLILFWSVTLVGALTSLVLDSWFAGGGRRRTLARMLIARTREALAASVAQAEHWRQQYGLEDLGPVVFRWQLQIVQLDSLDSESNEVTIETLETAANDAARQAEIARVLCSSLAAAVQAYAATIDRLRAIAKELTALNVDVAPAEYAKACHDILVKAAQAETGSMASGRQPSVPVVRRLGRLRRTVLWMDWLYAAVGWVVVGLIAYVTFYDRAWTFGTGRDYINVFLWTLGLTQTGSQLLARGKSSFTKL